MKTKHLRIIVAALCFLFSAGTAYVHETTSNSVLASAATPIAAPEDVLGFRPGDDRKLASWKSVVEYFQKLAAASDRVKFEELGKTTMGRPFVMATISAPQNLGRLK